MIGVRTGMPGLLDIALTVTLTVSHNCFHQWPESSDGSSRVQAFQFAKVGTPSWSDPTLISWLFHDTFSFLPRHESSSWALVTPFSGQDVNGFFFA